MNVQSGRGRVCLSEKNENGCGGGARVKGGDFRAEGARFKATARWAVSGVRRPER
jgi:hypothetical protein